MRSLTVLSGIRFSYYWFSEPVPAGTWREHGCAGVVAVLVRNPHWGPKPLQPLYFGESGNLPSGARRHDLLVAELPMPYSTAAQRRTLCQQLTTAYSLVSTAELARKVDELEAKQQEQSQQILSLLTYIGKLFEPQPVGPRKPIGFLAAPTESGS